MNKSWVLVCSYLLFSCSLSHAQDWPTYMADNGRGGVTTQDLPVPLVEQWTYRSPAEPRPAWPLPQAGWTELPRVDFDDALYTVADKDTIYFGSSVDHKIYALDAATGSVRWEFCTSGPVRLAPSLAHGNVYFGSDDGKVYCVRCQDGALVWTFEAAPHPKKVIGNGRVTSLWPVRTNVLVAKDRVFFGGGVFPYHKVFMFALDAHEGKVLWKNDTLSVFGGFSPQGYLLLTGNRLVVPSGRSLPLFVDADNGQLLFTGPPAGNKGEATGVYGTIVDGILYLGSQNTLFGINTQTGTSVAKWTTADRLLATPESYFLLKGPPPPAYGRRPPSGKANDITCFDRPAYHQLPRKDVEGLKKVKRWRYPRPDLSSMIVAGQHVIAGGNNEVVILDKDTGKQLWVGKVDGLAMGLTVANGRLLVSTTKGTIHCFGSGDPHPKPAVASKSWPANPSQKVIESYAQGILREAGMRKGFALVVGPGSARLACELAKHSEFMITSLEIDPQEVEPSRQRVGGTGFYGHRVSVEAGTLQSLPFPDYAANLIVVLDDPNQEPAVVKEIRRVLKPCGGVAFFGSLTKEIQPSADVLAIWKSTGALSTDVRVTPTARWTKLVRGPLEGSGWWTHQYADAGNSGSSHDQRVQGKLDVLWFGEPGPDEFPDRHLRGMAPLVMNGRVFCEGWNFLERKTTVFCFDAYNGVRYWKREVEGALRLGLPAVSGNLACDAENVFVLSGFQCVRLDALTGVTRAVYETPADAEGNRPPWAYLAVGDGLVLGSTSVKAKTGFSDSVFAFEIASGKLRWHIQAKEIRDTTLAYSSGQLLYVENRRPSAPKPKPLDKVKQLVNQNEQGPYLRTVVALDRTTGKPAWEKEVDLTDCGRWSNGSWGTLQGLAKDDVYVLGGAYTIYNGGKPLNEIPHRAMALSTRDGKVLWSEVVGNRSRPLIMSGALLAEPLFYDLHTGTKIMKKQGNTNRLAPWSMGPRTGGCGSLSASECMVFGRGGYTVWRDVSNGPAGAFIGMRPGCFINIIPAGGVVVQAEASSGCTCYQAIQCTVVFRPRNND